MYEARSTQKYQHPAWLLREQQDPPLRCQSWKKLWNQCILHCTHPSRFPQILIASQEADSFLDIGEGERGRPHPGCSQTIDAHKGRFFYLPSRSHQIPRLYGSTSGWLSVPLWGWSGCGQPGFLKEVTPRRPGKARGAGDRNEQVHSRNLLCFTTEICQAKHLHMWNILSTPSSFPLALQSHPGLCWQPPYPTAQVPLIGAAVSRLSAKSPG